MSNKGESVSNKVFKKGGLVSNKVSNKGENNNGNGVQRRCVGVQHSAQHSKGENKKKEYYKVEFF